MDIMHGIENIKELLRNIIDKEDEARESMPENLQESARYEESEEASEYMSDALTSLCDAYDFLYDIL